MTNEARKKFWVELVLSLIFAYVIPAGYLIYKYQIFQSISKVNLSGGAILLGTLTFCVLIVVFKYVVLKGPYARWKYVLKGFVFVIVTPTRLVPSGVTS